MNGPTPDDVWAAIRRLEGVEYIPVDRRVPNAIVTVLDTALIRRSLTGRNERMERRDVEAAVKAIVSGTSGESQDLGPAGRFQVSSAIASVLVLSGYFELVHLKPITLRIREG